MAQAVTRPEQRNGYNDWDDRAERAPVPYDIGGAFCLLLDTPTCPNRGTNPDSASPARSAAIAARARRDSFGQTTRNSTLSPPFVARNRTRRALCSRGAAIVVGRCGRKK